MSPVIIREIEKGSIEYLGSVPSDLLDSHLPSSGQIKLYGPSVVRSRSTVDESFASKTRDEGADCVGCSLQGLSCVVDAYAGGPVDRHEELSF
jgi:hypothetical protein